MEIVEQTNPENKKLLLRNAAKPVRRYFSSEKLLFFSIFVNLVLITGLVLFICLWVKNRNISTTKTKKLVEPIISKFTLGK